MIKILENKSNDIETVLLLLSCNGINTTKDFLHNFKKNSPLNTIHIVWLDNGSNDGTKDLLEKELSNIPNSTLFFSDSNLGVITGRNKIWEYSFNNIDCKLLSFLDNDQYVKENWYHQHTNFLKDGNYDIVGVEAWLMNKTFLPIEKIDSIKKGFTYVGCGGSLIKREVIEKIGFYDDGFNPSYFEDPDYIFRCLENNFKVGWNYKNLIQHLPHQTLGKIGNEEKNRRFIKSLKYFREKWKGKSFPLLKQNEVSNSV
jgi:GT2 family glycosyltransferase